MALLRETLASFVPGLALRLPAAGAGHANQPELERLSAAVLFADISGFTALTERLARAGPVGAEELARLLNDYFERLIGLIAAHGGEVAKFGGDAVLAVWPVGDEDLATATRRAAQCGLKVQAALHDARVAADVHLAMRIGIGAGNVAVLRVGGVGDHWHLVVAGSPVEQAGASHDPARPGEVVLSPNAWALVQNDAAGDRLQDGFARLDALRVGIPERRAVKPPPPPPEFDAALQTYIPEPVRQRLEAGQSEWLAELRRVTALFVGLPGLDYAAPTVLDQLQAATSALQVVLDRFEGTVLRLAADDKGTVLLAAFGLPPWAHEDDAARAARAALAMQRSLRELGFPSSIGVATGRAFCGTIGSSQQAEYTVMGDAINLAARLMQAATNDVLCDTSTYQSAHTRASFAELPAIHVKGKLEPVRVYQPLEQSPVSPPQRAMFGRDVERAQLAERVLALRKGADGAVLIHGEAGLGKSRLVVDLLEQASGVGIRTLVGAGDAVERSSPYHAWRPVFSALFDLDGITDTETRRQRVFEHVARWPELTDRASLLNSVLALDLPDNELTAQMTGDVRADNTRDILARLLASETGSEGDGRPLLIVLEDAHWLDSASWALAQRARQDIRRVLLVLATRPIDEPQPSEYRILRSSPETLVLDLTGLAQDMTTALVCERLSVRSIPEPVAAFLHERSEGNPFFSEELAYALRDGGLLRIANGACQLAPSVEVSALAFPDTVQGVVASRIDHLAPASQLALKVASVIGPVFDARLLQTVYPIEADRPNLDACLDELQQLDFTRLEIPEPDLAYHFKHVITQETAYNLLLFAQRSQLHRAVAEAIERVQATDLAPYYALLAHHWRRAEVKPKTLEYLDKAGRQTLRNAAYQEAVHFFGDALALDDQFRPEVATHDDRLRRASWERQLGEAQLAQGDITIGKTHLQDAVALLGMPIPRSWRQMAGNLLSQVLLQVLHRMMFRGRAWENRGPNAKNLEAARAFERLGQIYFFDNEMLLALYASIRALNLAEPAGVSPELARALANLGVTAGWVPLHPLARLYARRALETSERVNELSTHSWVVLTTALYNFGLGRWAESESTLLEVIKMAKRLGDQRRWGDSFALLGIQRYLQGDFARGLETGLELCTVGRRSANPQFEQWGTLQQAQNLLALGRGGDALDCAELAATLVDSSNRTERIWAHGALAAARWREGHVETARQAAHSAAELMASAQPTGSYTLAGYEGVTEVFVSLWEAGDTRAVAAARRACAMLLNFARVFPIGLARAYMWQGRAEWVAGQPVRAFTAWRKSLAVARRLSMPYDEGRVLYELGRHLPERDPRRLLHLERARDIFGRLGAGADLARVQALID